MKRTETDVTKRIAEYISRQKISVSQIQKDTGIDKNKLQSPSNEKLTAEEFLRLCSYLRIRPEEI